MSILEGSLNTATIGSVLEVLTSKNPAATWLISDGSDEKVIYFSTGGIRLYTSEGRKVSRLEEFFIQRRILTKDQLQMALKSTQDNRRESIDEVLERLEILTRAKYQEAVAHLIYLELCDVVSWENAIFEFYEGNPPPQIFDQNHPALFATLDVKGLAVRTGEWNQEWNTLRTKLYSERLRVRLPAVGGEPEKADPAFQNGRLLKAIDGQRTLREVAIAAACDFPEVARAAREGLRKGLLRGSIVPVKEPSTPGEVLDEIERLEEALDKAINTILIHKRIASGYEKIHENDRASEHYHMVGNLEADAGRLFKALENYRHAIALSPQNLGAHESLIRRLQDWGEDEKALEEIASLAKKLFSFGFVERAYESLRAIATKITHLLDIRLLFADILSATGRKSEAMKEYMDVIREKKRKGALDGIEEIYHKVLSLDPGNREARSGLSRERLRHAGKKVLWIHRISAAAAVLIIIAWAGSEFAARKAWGQEKGSIDAAISQRKYSEGFDKLRRIGARYPGNRLSPNLLGMERTLFREALFRLEGEMESADALRREGKFREARRLFQTVKDSGLVESQERRAAEAIREADAAQGEFEDLRKNAEFFLQAGSYEDSFFFARKLVAKFPEAAGGIRIPFFLRSSPRDASVSVEGMIWGRTPFWIILPYRSQKKVLIEKEGYAPQAVDLWANLRSPFINITFQRAKGGSPGTGR